MQDKLIEAAQHVVDEMERGYTIIGPVSRLKEALAAVRAHDAGTKMPNSEQYENASHAAESTAQLDAEDQHPRYGVWKGFAGSQVRVDPSMPIDEIRVEHPSGRVDRIVNVAPAAEPVEGVPSGYVKLEDVEKAIDDEWMSVLEGHVTLPAFINRLRARLAPKPEPSQSAVIDTLRSEDFQRANACIECGTLVVHQELHAKWHAALVERRTK